MMGTSVAMLDETYGHLLHDSAARVTAQLDAFNAKDAEAFGRGVGTAD